MGGREAQEGGDMGIYVYIQLIHFVLQQKLTQHCKAIITPIKKNIRASLVAQWLRIHLPMQGTQVRALVREDPTCRGATKPVRHNY